MTISFVALGANLNDPATTIQMAIEAMRELPQSRMTAASSLYRTAPVGLRNQPDFINAVVSIETQLGARQLLDELFSIEAQFGRRRSVPNAPRTLDLDLLLHGQSVSSDPQLTLPHPRMHLRAFVLAPLAEIAPRLMVPGRGEVEQLLVNCKAQKIESLTTKGRDA